MRGVFTARHMEAVQTKLALNPELGGVVPKTGGARKIRQFGTGGRSRLIYYFHSGDSEVFFLACYPKNRKTDLTENEKAELKKITKLIKDSKKRRAK